MTTDVIDLTFHGSSFPTTYIGVGTKVGNPQSAVAVPSTISGYFTGAGNVVSIPVGFQPSHVQIINETDNIQWDWFRGLAATHTIKQVAAGTTTVDTTTAIAVSTDLAGNCTITLTAALAVNSSNIIYVIDA
jgi:hypothetical protein